MLHTSYIEISKSAYRQNLKFIRSQLGDQVMISSVVKGNAYGHGIENIVYLAESNGIRHFSTFSADEAKRVYEASQRNSQIMIMGMVSDDVLPWVIEKGIGFYVFEFERLYQAVRIARKQGKEARIHVEVETGFHRTGFEWQERDALLRVLKENEAYLDFRGLCTHYAGAESVANYVRVKDQIKKYAEYKAWFLSHGIRFKTYHTACSAASLSYPETIMDMVRIGIAQYGFWPSQETYMFKFKHLADNMKNPLKRLISWKSQIMSVKKVKMGDFIGYGNSYMASRDMIIALVPVGYCHGFSRNLSNLGKVLIHGKILSVVGTVTMNAISVDITDLDNPQKGDEVVIIGRQKRNEITVASFGESTQQVNYELLTRLPQDIPRRFRS
ncbi:alanine racemase [Lunatimonas salinarum]|uniref:alanine racemase n=1 Tax=Lunatimonas salinarum TaxID=1774590 RepID=UPI001ADFB683|nr:alanine racemase [Lunatimonas salinarum]